MSNRAHETLKGGQSPAAGANSLAPPALSPTKVFGDDEGKGLGGGRVVDQPIAALTSYPRNARVHSKKQIAQIAASIRAFGFVNPVLVDDKNRILAGHGRVEAAKSLRWVTVPTLCVKGLSEAEIKAYVIADNRLAELSGWDKAALALEVGELTTLDVNFDVAVIGFEIAEPALEITSAKTAHHCVCPICGGKHRARRKAKEN